MKLLIWVALGVLAWLWWRYLRVTARHTTPPKAPPPPAANPQAMIDCPVCGLHLPQADAVPGRLGAYCSEGHRARHEG